MFNLGDRVQVTGSNPSEAGWTGTVIELNPLNGDDCVVLIDQNEYKPSYNFASLTPLVDDSRVAAINDFLTILEELKIEILNVRETILNI